MKHLSVIILLCALAFAAGAQIATPVAVSNLPAYTVGVGPAWTRGNASPYSVDVTVGVHIGQSQWYSWTDINTPVATSSTNSLPVASAITTGGAWVAYQSPTGAVSLIFIVQAGFSTPEATSTMAPSFSGSLCLAARIGKTHLYAMPCATAANATTSSTSGSLATAVFQPRLQLLYTFGGK